MIRCVCRLSAAVTVASFGVVSLLELLLYDCVLRASDMGCDNSIEEMAMTMRR